MEFGERVREIRTERGLSITALADHLGVTKVYVSDVERGRRAPFSLTRIKQVSDVLGCDPFDLYLLAVRSRGHVVLPTSDIGEECVMLTGGRMMGERTPPPSGFDNLSYLVLSRMNTWLQGAS